ncbi:hypothetical protein PWR63_08280 [Paraburkholderia sp. A2WS-5]|uniref:hypothetical protein n=1 Tax=unclassified Paraburkholderia TaxID=2615204 RepID=UPI003B7C270A
MPSSLFSSQIRNGRDGAAIRRLNSAFRLNSGPIRAKKTMKSASIFDASPASGDRTDAPQAGSRSYRTARRLRLGAALMLLAASLSGCGVFCAAGGGSGGIGGGCGVGTGMRF